MIPKIIHYCWFGGNPLPPLALECIASWRKFFPDYEIWQRGGLERKQEQVDRNRAAAPEHGYWWQRMRDVMRWLAECRYEV